MWALHSKPMTLQAIDGVHGYTLLSFKSAFLFTVTVILILRVTYLPGIGASHLCLTVTVCKWFTYFHFKPTFASIRTVALDRTEHYCH